MKLDLLVLGDTAIDNFYEVQKIPKLNEASDVATHHRYYGGMGANTAVVACNLGLNVGLVSVIGTDAEDYRKYMESMGIKLYLKGIFGDTTKSMFFKENGDQISFFYKGVTERLDDLDVREEFGKNLVKNVGTLFLARTYLGAQKKAIKLYKDSLVVYNPGYGVYDFDKIPRSFRTVVNNSQVLVLNQHEYEHLKKLGFKIKFGVKPKVFIETRGSEGCRVHTKNTTVNVNPVKDLEAIDASGAGDAFNAGLIAAYSKDYDIYQSVAIGNATSSFIVEEWGCQTNIPTWNQVKERYNSIR